MSEAGARQCTQRPCDYSTDRDGANNAHAFMVLDNDGLGPMRRLTQAPAIFARMNNMTSGYL
eukprot:6801700-Alexandrium_andersonii.AAC.1